jgi:hypothetical protein
MPTSERPLLVATPTPQLVLTDGTRVMGTQRHPLVRNTHLTDLQLTRSVSSPRDNLGIELDLARAVLINSGTIYIGVPVTKGAKAELAEIRKSPTPHPTSHVNSTGVSGAGVDPGKARTC